MKILFDRVILSCNMDVRFIDYLPLVSTAWRKFFNVKVTLGLVSEECQDWIKEYCDDIVLFKPSEYPTINEGVLSKLARHIIASLYSDDVCLINDLDLVPLSRWYLEERLSKREHNKLLLIGGEYFRGEDYGMTPMGNVTGEGKIFREFLNPNNYKNIIDIFNYWDSIEHFRPDKFNKTTSNTFSDELLYRTLLKEADIEEKIIRMDGIIKTGSGDPKEDHILDRVNWNLDINKLFSGYYSESHLLRPREEFLPYIAPIEEYIYSL